MNNVFLSTAIRLCCESRATPRVSVRRIVGSFTYLNAGRRPLAEIIPRSRVSRDSARALSITTRLEARRRTKQPSQFPESNVEPAPNSGTHREGQLDTEQWRDYDPAGGLPLPDGELSQEQVNAIFTGSEIDVDNGNYILCVLHWRRMSGALIDIGIDFPRSAMIEPAQAAQGLQYLRSTYPQVDEQGLGAKWAEEESEKMRQELQNRAIKLRLYKPTTSPEEAQEEESAEEVEEESQQGTEYGRERSGTSAAQGLFAAMRERRAEREEKKIITLALKERSLLHTARGPLELDGGVQPQVGIKRYGTMDVVLREPDSIATLETVERKPWVRYYEDQATLVKENTVPQLSTARRLIPSFLVMLLTVAACLYLSENYTPPPTEARLFPSIPPSVATIGGLSIALVGMFLLSRFPPFWRINNKYFCIVPAFPYAMSNLGAMFRHDTFAHLATNTLTLWLIGLSLHEDVGRGTFLAIFFGTGSVGTFTSLMANVLQKNWLTWIGGSSGAVLGVLGALCTLRPNGIVSVFGYELPMAAWLLLAVVSAAEVFAFARRKRTTTDHAGHVGGLISGVAAAAYLKWKYDQKKATAPEPVMRATKA
ncbi:hypothetical protein AMS68_006917 [Peltaster fructicola]|uniref:Peptidase S54 rhomboid domain-containing protein n=1 Tax=Peltaster fructicola TaxID=286661 RepID=A0A6H0Y458_9PEZI|nr:hypothetical protein AMS68_006917 [Peltaster fructicola]